MVYIALYFSLCMVSHFADYLYQADMHGWWLPKWWSKKRATDSFAMFDHWHITQMIRNLIWKLGSLVFAILFYQSFRWWVVVIGMYVIDAIARGIGFSLTRKLTK